MIQPDPRDKICVWVFAFGMWAQTAIAIYAGITAHAVRHELSAMQSVAVERGHGSIVIKNGEKVFKWNSGPADQKGTSK